MDTLAVTRILERLEKTSGSRHFRRSPATPPISLRRARKERERSRVLVISPGDCSPACCGSDFAERAASSSRHRSDLPDARAGPGGCRATVQCRQRGMAHSAGSGSFTRRARVYFTAPAAMPLIIKRSRRMPITISGRMAASERAAIDHQEIPWEPVWLATMTGSVLACVEVRRAAKNTHSKSTLASIPNGHN